MKFLKSITSILLLSVVLFACKKDSDNTPSVTFQGTWEGKFGNDNDVPSVFFSLRFKAAGVLEEVDADGSLKGTGTYSIDNNTIVGHTVNSKAPVGNKYSYVAAFYPSQGKVLGNWGFGNSATNGGTFELTTKK